MLFSEPCTWTECDEDCGHGNMSCYKNGESQFTIPCNAQACGEGEERGEGGKGEWGGEERVVGSKKRDVVGRRGGGGEGGKKGMLEGEKRRGRKKGEEDRGGREGSWMQIKRGMLEVWGEGGGERGRVKGKNREKGGRKERRREMEDRAR